MIMLNHQHLYYFWTVAKEGSVSAACKTLHLAQPTISGQIIQLEKFLGKPLFERHRKRLLLTDTGRLVLSYAESIFGQTQEMLEKIGTSSGSVLRLILGVDVTISSPVIVDLLKSIQISSPLAHIQVEHSTLPNLIQRLKRFSIHFVITDQPGLFGDVSDLVRTEIARMGLFFAASPALKKRVRRYPEDLAKVPLILPAQSSPSWGPMQHFFIKNRIKPAQIMEIQNPDLIRLAVINGLGCSVFHDWMIQEDIAQKRLARLGPGPTGLTKTLWILARKGSSPSQFMDEIVKRFKDKTASR